MSKVPAIIPVSDLREDAANILDRMKKSNEAVVITQRGRAAAVMVSVEEYERSNHEREILRLLAQGTRRLRRARATNWKTCSRKQSGFLRNEGPVHDLRAISVPGRA